MENKNIVSQKSKSVSGRVRYSGLSLYEIFAKVQKQIDYQSFLPADRKKVREIAMLIAEVYRLPETAIIHIDGNSLNAEMVSEVYDQLRFEHVSLVLARFDLITYNVRHVKTYLRTALYNSVFENETRLENAVRANGF